MPILPIFLVIFIGVPLIEIYLLIEVGSVIGALPTVLAVVFTAVPVLDFHILLQNNHRLKSRC